jgi:hypothetical protein
MINIFLSNSKMAHILSVDTIINMVFGVTMALIGVITIVQTARLARLYRRASGMSETAEWGTQPYRLTSTNIVPDIERGHAASIEMNVPTSEPDTEDQTYPTRHSAQSEVNVQVSGEALAGPSMESLEGSMAPGSMTE